MDKVNVREYWCNVIIVYNKILFVKKINLELDDYVICLVLGGMFGMIEKKELDIWENLVVCSIELL